MTDRLGATPEYLHLLRIAYDLEYRDAHSEGSYPLWKLNRGKEDGGIGRGSDGRHLRDYREGEI